mmetsp:Transcript_48643/g.80680  ORF Transcript_48643/g.80680 Transcript_48643/m.80680 type:complete len:338 (+) Transcript_48643:66-1079(+)
MSAQCQEVFALIYGETQVGKSSFVNAILEEKVAVSGGGDGHSVTAVPEVHSKRFEANPANGIPSAIKLLLMDTPGNLDTALRWSDATILSNIRFAITSSSRHLQRINTIFLAESLSSDSIQIARNLQKLKSLFGESVMQSVVVLALKPTLSRTVFGDARRIEAVKAMCNRLQLPYLVYESRQSRQWNGNQLKRFMTALFDANRRPFEMREIEETRRRIEQQAQELMAADPVQYKTVSYEVEVDKLQEYQEEEAYYVTESRYAGKGRRRYGVAGPREDKYENVSVRKTHMVTKYRPYKETESRVRQDEIPKNVEKYRMQAMREWEQQMRRSIQIKVVV